MMTNNEAIGILGLAVGTAKGRCFVTDEAISEAYGMAIKALKAQDVPDTNVGDTISRQAAYIALVEKGQASRRYKLGETWELNGKEIREVLDALQPAQPERKGKWVGYDGDWLKTMCKCSKCGAMIDINEKYRNFFCYHCGARMDGERDESN